MKLKNKMTLAVSTLVVVLTAAVALFSLGYFERKLQETIAGQQLSIVSYIADEIDHVLLTSRDLLVASADIFPLDTLSSPERARDFLRTRTSLHRLFNNHLMVVGADGFRIAESYPSPDGDNRLNLTDAPFFRETLQSGKPVISGLATCCADLSPTQVIMTAPVRDPDGTIRTALRQEVGQRTRAQEEISWLNDDLERQKTALMAANRELESFGFSVSHDLRAPLRHIEGFSTVLLEDCCDRLDADGRGYLDRIVAACRRMDELITDLLNLSRLSQGEVRRERVDLSAMAAVAEGLHRGEPQRRVNFRIGSGLSAICDPSLVRILLENLLGNAWKYTARKDRGVIEFGAAGEGGETVFFVRDNGAGFDMAWGERLFVPFQRLHPAGEFEGTGIGLATVRIIAIRHGGRVWAEGDPGTGATFFFTL